MANRLSRSLAVLLSGVSLFGALVASAASPLPSPPGQSTHAYLTHAAVAPLRPARLAQVGLAYRGGPVTTSTGEVVDVRVSETLPLETTPESWAEFLAGLTHGPELARLQTFIVSFAEVQEICGSRAIGCYGQNRLVAPGEVAAEITPEEVVRHEYGHHVADNRLNAPWAAVDWGPKRWASAANVCAKVSRREAYPGDQGANYARNPGEAWAETYRLMDERKNGISTAAWPIVASSFYPDEAALQAAEQDVLQPWTRSRTSVSIRVFGRGTPKAWVIPLPATLDGELRISATLPKGGTHDVALVGADRRAVVKRAQWVGQRLKRIQGSICGQRSLFVRITQKGTLGRVRVSVTTP